MKSLFLSVTIFIFAQMASAHSKYLTVEETQSEINKMIDDKEIAHPPVDNSTSNLEELHHPPVHHPDGPNWYLGCFSSDYYGYIYPNYGYNAYYTQARAWESCRIQSPAANTCYNLGCEVYYY